MPIIKNNEFINEQSKQKLEEMLKEPTLELNKLYKELESTKARLTITLEAAQMGTWRWDINEDKLFIDNQIAKLFHLPSKDGPYNADTIYAFVMPDDLAQLKLALKESFENKQQLNHEYRINLPDNSVRWVNCVGKVYYDEKNQPSYMLGVSSDITARKILEQKHLQAVIAKSQEEQRAKEAERYRQQQEEFSDTICHELRNPLNGIYGAIESFKEECQNFNKSIKKHSNSISLSVGNDFSQILKNIDETVKTLSLCAEQQKIILDDVLDFSNIESSLQFAKSYVEPNQPIQSAINIFNLQFLQKNLQLKYEPLNENSLIEVDEKKLTCIIINVLSNAIKFTPDYGTISIKLEKQILSNEEMQLSIQIRDTGVGMSEDEINRLLTRSKQRHSRIDAQYGGSGLGLIICNRLLEMMGGTLTIKSQKELGSDFKVSLRCKYSLEKKLEHAAIDDVKNIFPLTAKLQSILIVEDNIINQKLLAKHLREAGYTYDIAENGQVAVERVNKYHYDIIFMDVEMPVMNGLDATRKIRELEQCTNKKSTIIGLSGNARAEQIQKGKDAGMDEYITKPYSKGTILTMIDKYTKANVFSNTARPIARSLKNTMWSDGRMRGLVNEFKSSASQLINKQFSFSMDYKPNLLIISLPESEYLYQYILNDLMFHLNKFANETFIKEIKLHNNELHIMGHESATLNELRVILSESGLIKQPLENHIQQKSNVANR